MNVLAIQNSYDELQIAILDENKVIDYCAISKFDASKQFIIKLETILTKNNTVLSDFPFIAVNRGPGPFTTLRVVIASVNGLSFANHIPLIGIDALDACILEWKDEKYPYTVVLLNAFGDDVYFAIAAPDQPVKKGYDNIITLLEKIKKLFPKTEIRFLGNGTSLHRKAIQDHFENAFIPSSIPNYCSVSTIGIIGSKKWEQGDKGSTQLLPLYLKKHPVEQ